MPILELRRSGIAGSVPHILGLALALLFCSATLSRSFSEEPKTGDEAVADSDSDQASSTTTESRPVQTYMGRQIAPPMHYSGAGWLTRESRVREENPTRLLASLNLKGGQVVCDFGCGNGYHTLELAKRVGPQGQVVAIDIQPEMLELLAERAAPRGLANIKPVLATEKNSGLPPASFDLVLMVDVYHELSHPVEVLAEVRKSLKPAGRLVLVEFREEDPTVPILPLHKMSQAQVLRELSPNGFKLVAQFDELPWQHVLHFARNDSPLPAIELKPWQPTEK